MTKVLILGATGYVGRRLVDLLVSSGRHQVFGIARNDAKAKSLAVAEVTPIICPDPVNEPRPYLEAIKNFNIDVVVDVAGANHGSANFLRDIRQVGERRLQEYKTSRVQGSLPKLGFIYCSGTWVHGSSQKPVNDLDMVGPCAVTPPAALVRWRVDLENSILASRDVLDVAIIRPALIYGRENTIWTPFILPLLTAARRKTQDQIEIPLDEDSAPGLVHVDDVASGFLQAVEKISLINNGSIHPVFDLVTSQERMTAIFEGLCSAWGLRCGFKLVGSGEDKFAAAMSTSFRGSSSRAKQLLEWNPLRLNGLVQDIEVYAAAFASQH